jgi:ribokinase
MKKKILVIGSSNTDMVVYTKHLPSPGETVMGGEFKVFAGGKGANQAVAAARSGGEVIFLGAFGEDSFGAERIADLDREGIDTSRVKRMKDVSSGVALIMVDSHAENIISVAPGANDRLFPADLDRVEFSEFGLVVIQMEIPLETVEAAIERAARAGCFTILNPAPARPLPKRVLKKVDLLIPNRGELEVVVETPVPGDDALIPAARKILEEGPRNLVVTLGSKGSLLVEPEGTCQVDAPRVKAVDTTGAGGLLHRHPGCGLEPGK